MKLPRLEVAAVPPEKIAGYLLAFSHQTGRAKADFFSRFGFTAEAWEVLARALLSHAAAHEVARLEAFPLGTRYAIKGPWRPRRGDDRWSAPSGSSRKVRTRPAS